MKLLLVSPDVSGNLLAGETIFAKNLIAGLTDRGMDPEICQLKRISHTSSILAKPIWYSRLPRLIDTYQKLKKFRDYDIIHFLNASMAVAGFSQRKAVKIATSHVLGRSHYTFYEPHGAIEWALESSHSLYSSAIDGFALNSLDRVVTSSPYHAKDIAETYGLRDSKVQIIPPGIDVSALRKLPRTDLKSQYGCDKVILYIGRLNGFRKGFQHLIDAVRPTDSFKILVVGSGPEHRYFERRVREKGLESRFVFLGHLNFEKKSILQKSADAVVIPSLSESFCMVFAESLACGVPVVAFDMPFWKGLYDGAAHFVEKDHLADGISAVLNDARLRKGIISKGRSLVKNFDVKKTVSGYTALYESFNL